VNFSRKVAQLLVLAGVGIFPIALAAQDSNGAWKSPRLLPSENLLVPTKAGNDERPACLGVWLRQYDRGSAA